MGCWCTYLGRRGECEKGIFVGLDVHRYLRTSDAESSIELESR